MRIRLGCVGIAVWAALVAMAAVEEGIRWEPLGEPGSGGWMTGIAVSPHDGKRVVLGGDMLGIGLSTDRGESWQATFGLPSYEIGDLTWHPSDAQVVWAGTMSGPCVSTDGGKTWVLKRKGLPALSDGIYSAPVEVVRLDPNDAKRVLAFGGSSRRWASPGKPAWGAVWESKDSGESWARLATVTTLGSAPEPEAAGRNIVGAVFAAGSSAQVYAAVEGSGVLVSEDGGKTWAPRNPRSAGLPHPNIERVVAHPKERDTLWVCLTAYKPPGEATHLPGGVFKSTDAGKTWKNISGGLPAVRHADFNLSTNFKGFAVAASNPDVMYVCDGAWNTGVVYRTSDGGGSWRPVATKQNVNPNTTDPARPKLLEAARIDVAYFSGCTMTVMAVDPRDPEAVYAAGSEYLLRSRDGGKTWIDATARRVKEGAGLTGQWQGRGYSGLCSINFRFDAFRKARAVLLAMDAGKCWESTDGLKSWTFHGAEPQPWGGGNDAAFAQDGRGYATTGQFKTHPSVVRFDGAKCVTLQGAGHGLPEFGSAKMVAQGVYTLPGDSQQVWAVVGGQLYHSKDGGEKWEVVEVGAGLAWIAGDPRNGARPARFYVSGAKSVYLTEDAGGKFRAIGGPKYAGKMAVDGLGRLYVCGYRSPRPGLWRYAEGKWARLLDEYYAANVAVDPSDPNRVMVATNDDPYHDVCKAPGVLISADAGKTWTAENAGLAVLRGHAVAFNPFEPEQVVFGSQGRGFFVGRWAKAYKPVGGRVYAATAEDERFGEVLR